MDPTSVVAAPLELPTRFPEKNGGVTSSTVCGLANWSGSDIAIVEDKLSVMCG